MNEVNAGSAVAKLNVGSSIDRMQNIENPLDNSPGLRDQLEKVAASVPGLICSFRLHPDGSVSMPYASPAIVDLYGLNPEDVATDASPLFSRMPSEDARHVMRTVLESARAMTQWRDEWRIHHPLKGERWIDGCSMPIREADGSILWHGYLNDVTERKEREQRIAKLNAFQQLVTNAVPALISYVDTDLRYRMVNRHYENWYGLKSSEIVGRSVRELFGEVVWQRVLPYVSRALAGEFVEYEVEHVRDESGPRWMHVSYLPDIDADGRVRGIVVMATDRTENRRILEELKRSRQQLVDLMSRHDAIRESERKHVAREIHDELGQLLTGMRMAISALQLRSKKGRPPNATGTIEQLGLLLDEATSVVRRVSSSLRPVLLEHGLLPALEVLATDFRNRTQISCRLTVSGNSRDISDMLATTVFRIVQESLTNIARHAKAQSVLIHLSYEAACLRLLIQDDGRGFDPELAKKSGLGLGLVGMQERASIAGGGLTIFSTPGSGTRVELEVPLNSEENK